MEVNLGHENDWFLKDSRMLEDLYDWLIKSRNNGIKVMNLTVSLSQVAYDPKLSGEKSDPESIDEQIDTNPQKPIA